VTAAARPAGTSRDANRARGGQFSTVTSVPIGV